jgi:hypothetical protein
LERPEAYCVGGSLSQEKRVSVTSVIFTVR